MSRIEVIPIAPLDGSSGFAFSVRVDDEPRILLDAGRGPSPAQWLDQGAAHDIVWISHGHHDHAGGLADVLQRRPQIDVVLPAKAAPTARAIATASGMDDVRAHAIYDNATKAKFHQEFEVGPFKALTVPSGHGSGAGMLRLELGDLSIGYTGDWALHPRTGAQPADLSALRGVDLLICECALVGAKRLDDWSQMESISELFRFFDHDGPRLAAVSAFGEFDELLALVRNRDDLLVESGLEPFAPDVPCADRSQCAAHLAKGGLVVAHGPSLSATEPAGELAIPHVTGPDTRIAVFNAVPRGSDAATLVGARRRERRTIYGQNRRIRAQIRRFDFPSHATRPQILRAIELIAPRALMPFHQSPTVLDHFGRELRDGGFAGDIVQTWST